VPVRLKPIFFRFPVLGHSFDHAFSPDLSHSTGTVELLPPRLKQDIVLLVPARLNLSDLSVLNPWSPAVLAAATELLPPRLKQAIVWTVPARYK